MIFGVRRNAKFIKVVVNSYSTCKIIFEKFVPNVLRVVISVIHPTNKYPLANG